MKNYVNKNTGEVMEESVVSFFQEYKATEDLINALQENIAEIQKEADRKSEHLKERLKDLKEDKLSKLQLDANELLEHSNEKTIATEYGEIKKRKSSTTVYQGNVEELPEGFFKLKKTADKKAIKSALEKGIQIEGASIEKKESITISLVK